MLLDEACRCRGALFLDDPGREGQRDDAGVPGADFGGRGDGAAWCGRGRRRGACAGFGGAKRQDPSSLSGRVNPAAPLPDQVFTDTASHLRKLFAEGRPIVGICAAGILIRILAPLLADKRDEPPVIAVSEDGGERRAAARRPSRRERSCARPCRGARQAMPPSPPPATTASASRSTRRRRAGRSPTPTTRSRSWPRCSPARPRGSKAMQPGCAASRIPFAPDGAVRLVAHDTLRHHGRCIARWSTIRVAWRSGSAASAMPIRARRSRSSRRTLHDAGLARASVALVASIDLKADEPAVLEARDRARRAGALLRRRGAGGGDAAPARTRRRRCSARSGCHGVAEGAALAAAGPQGALVVAKQKSARVTCAIAEAPDIIEPTRVGRARGRLAIVGIGPGSAEWLTPEARATARGERRGRRLLALSRSGGAAHRAMPSASTSTLGSEEARVRQALALAAEGRSVALVSSGDAGIYAMAALVFECLDETDSLSDRCPLRDRRGARHLRHAGGGGARRARRSGTISAPSRSPTC